MKKLNEIIYHKLLLQAEEAKEQKLTRLASGVMAALGPTPENEKASYSFQEVEDDVHNGLWSIATCVLKYHDVSSVDAQKLDAVLEVFAYKLINDIEEVLNKTNTIGVLEPPVFGQK